MPVRGGRTAASELLTSAGKRSQSPRRRVVVGYRDAAAKISHLVVNSVHAVLPPEPLADTSVLTWQTLCAAPPTDGHNAIRDIERHRRAAVSSRRRRDGLMLLATVGPAAGR
jgi:hypothetical protein